MAKNGRGPVDWTVVVQIANPGGCHDEVVVQGSAPTAEEGALMAVQARSVIRPTRDAKTDVKAADGA